MKIDAEEKFKNQYPLTYSDLIEKLKVKYENFRQTKDFHSFMKKIKQNENYH